MLDEPGKSPVECRAGGGADWRGARISAVATMFERRSVGRGDGPANT
jgi:hypothetical protein